MYEMNSLKKSQIEHHHGLSFCLNLKMGLGKQVSMSRLKPYVNWFYKKHLFSHFQIEENVLFPILGLDNKKIAQAISEHKRLRRLFEDDTEVEHSVRLIAKELDHHIRYEEKIVFPEITKVATKEQVTLLQDIHFDVLDSDDWEDQFWN